MTACRRRVGTVCSVHPARRQVRVRCVAGGELLLDRAEWVWLALQDGSDVRCKVEQVLISAPDPIVTFARGVTRENVSKARGAGVEVEASRAERSEDDAYDVALLRGFDVFGPDGARLGAVSEVYAAGQSGAFEVKKCQGGSVTLPAVPQVIARVDWREGAVFLKDTAPYAVEDAD